MRKLKAGTLICAMMALFVIIIVLASRHRAPARKAAESAASMASGAVRAQPAPPPSCSDAPEPVDISVAAEAKLKWLRKELGEDFIFQRAGVFVVAGDLPRRQMERIVNGSLLGCAECMWKDYFVKRPKRPLVVLLFEEDKTYRDYSQRLFGFRPSTPFGYYLRADGALVMNISTGTGTLVHELFHALRQPDFPDCPTWADEGMASLHEQCAWRDGSLAGLVNWRLPALQEAMRENELVPLKKLFAMSAEEFYGEGQALNYAEARYLCMYIQEKGRLKEFYAKFRSAHSEDPTGLKTVEMVLKADIGAVQTAWLGWVKTLKWPER